jgi:hypothetical protein
LLALILASVVDASASSRMAVLATSLYLLGVSESASDAKIPLLVPLHAEAAAGVRVTW